MTDQRKVIPVAEERAVVEVRERPGATVRVRTSVESHEETIETALTAEEFDVERVPVGRFVDAALPVRSEGETTVIPLHEEVTVVEKRLRLVEEVRVTRRQATRQQVDRVTLRRENVTIDRSEET